MPEKAAVRPRTAVNLWTADYIRILFLNFLVGCTLFIQVSTLPSYILDLGGTKAFVGLSMGLFLVLRPSHQTR